MNWMDTEDRDGHRDREDPIMSESTCRDTVESLQRENARHLETIANLRTQLDHVRRDQIEALVALQYATDALLRERERRAMHPWVVG